MIIYSAVFCNKVLFATTDRAKLIDRLKEEFNLSVLQINSINKYNQIAIRVHFDVEIIYIQEIELDTFYKPLI